MNEDDPYKEVVETNMQAVEESRIREDDEDHSEEESDEARIARIAEIEFDASKENETFGDNPAVRLALYYALKDSRAEPGLSIKRVASVVSTAWEREEVAMLVKELSRNLDA